MTISISINVNAVGSNVAVAQMHLQYFLSSQNMYELWQSMEVLL